MRKRRSAKALAALERRSVNYDGLYESVRHIFEARDKLYRAIKKEMVGGLCAAVRPIIQAVVEGLSEKKK